MCSIQDFLSYPRLSLKQSCILGFSSTDKWLSQGVQALIMHYYFRMGNSSICCNDNHSNLQENLQIDRPKFKNPLICHETIQDQAHYPLSLLPLSLLKIVQQSNVFERELLQFQKANLHLLGLQRYSGLVDQEKLPTGFGSLINQNNTYYLGYFKKGKASGLGFYFFSQNCYYLGQMVQSKAHDSHGFFKNHQIQYSGGFLDNKFQGLGHEIGKFFQFNGNFEKGLRKQGQLKWLEEDLQFVYKGFFDTSGRFNGRGKLSEPLGSYQGQFVAGKKQGYGIYKFKSQLRYQGYYKDNKKHGRGQIIKKDGTIAFAGQFLQGLPLGKGYYTDLKGNKFSLDCNQQTL